MLRVKRSIRRPLAESLIPTVTISGGGLVLLVVLALVNATCALATKRLFRRLGLAIILPAKIVLLGKHSTHQATPVRLLSVLSLLVLKLRSPMILLSMVGLIVQCQTPSMAMVSMPVTGFNMALACSFRLANGVQRTPRTARQHRRHRPVIPMRLTSALHRQMDRLLKISLLTAGVLRMAASLFAGSNRLMVVAVLSMVSICVYRPYLILSVLSVPKGKLRVAVIQQEPVSRLQILRVLFRGRSLVSSTVTVSLCKLIFGVRKIVMAPMVSLLRLVVMAAVIRKSSRTVLSVRLIP